MTPDKVMAAADSGIGINGEGSMVVSVPVSTTPITALPHVCAAKRNSGSTAGREWISFCL
jgi:hypothetical protein